MIAGLAVYANSLHGPMLLDDHRSIEANTSIRELWPLTAVLHPPLQNPVTGRPIVNLSFALNYALGGLAVEGYHLWNIAVHVLAALLLLGVLRRTFARAPLLGSDAGTSDGLALVCALAWALHPLNTEAVNYLTQRTESMMGLFYLLTLYAAIRALQTDRWGQGGVRPRRWELLAGVAALCGVASKESTLTVPLVVMLWDRIFAFPTFREAWTQRRRLYGIVAASWLLFAYFARELPFFSATGFEEQVSRWTYLLNQAPIVTQYLGLSVWPHGLIFDYGTPLPVTLGAVWPGLTLVAVLLGLTAAALVRVPALGFWGAWFFITLAPASSLIPIPTEVGAERRMYLPLISVIVVLVTLGAAVLRRVTPATLRTRVAGATATVMLLALALVTVQRNDEYRTGLGIWQTVLDRRPHARAHEHLSMYLRDTGKIDESVAHLRIAAPGSTNARHALASALLERGDVAGSVTEFREFVRLKPRDPHIIEAREEFAAALVQAGDIGGAVAQWRAVVAAAPGYARGHVGLADALSASKDPTGAQAEYREALRLQPGHLIALINLGTLLASTGETDEAVAMLRHALQVEPRALTPRRQIMAILLAQRRFGDLESETRTLLSLVPDDADGHNILGVALASQGRFGPASEQFARALQLSPTHRDARENMARANDVLTGGVRAG